MRILTLTLTAVLSGCGGMSTLVTDAGSSDAGGGAAMGGGTATGGGGGGGTGGSAGTGGGVAACSAANCPTGCCHNGSCQTGNVDTACGKSGAACAACTGIEICLADKSCGVDPDSNWKVQPASATIAATNAPPDGGAGTDWDPVVNKEPDAFCEMYCPADDTTKHKTATVDNSLTPVWTDGSCVARAGDLMTKGFKITMYDDDTVSGNDLMLGPAIVPVTKADLLSGNINVSMTGTVNNLSITLTKQ